MIGDYWDQENKVASAQSVQSPSIITEAEKQKRAWEIIRMTENKQENNITSGAMTRDRMCDSHKHSACAPLHRKAVFSFPPLSSALNSLRKMRRCYKLKTRASVFCDTTSSLSSVAAPPPPHTLLLLALKWRCASVCTLPAADCEGHAASHNFLGARNKSSPPSFSSALKREEEKKEMIGGWGL